MKAIGVVHNNLGPGISAPRQRAERSELEILPEFAEGLQGVAPGQHIVVLFRFHLSGEAVPLLQHPEGDPQNPLRGVFTLRSPRRPNPIGLSTVRVVDAQGNRLIVAGLDAYDGSPILDIKPYIPYQDEPQMEGAR
jgi:tRNA-Thr(GGU) m(6)t(6)A37 methyltransferase TsaA